MVAAQGTVIEVTYTIKNQDGVLLEERAEVTPAHFIFGLGQVLPVIESTIEGQGEGFIKSIVVPESEAFGPYKDDLVTRVHRSALPGDGAIKVGTRFKTSGPNGDKIVIRVVDVEDEMLTLDGNHPLAGNDLHIDIRILSVRKATEEELKRGAVIERVPSNRTIH